MFSESDLGKVVKYIYSDMGDVNGEPIKRDTLFKIVQVLDDGRIKVRDHLYGFDNGISDLRLCIYCDEYFKLV